MNIVCLIGRLTKDIEIRQTNAGKAYTRFSIAVQRTYKDQSGNYPADFINCVAWGQTAGYLAKYASKGSKVSITGQIQTSSYKDNMGNVKSSTDIMVGSASVIDKKPETQKPTNIAPDMNALGRETDTSEFDAFFG